MQFKLPTQRLPCKDEEVNNKSIPNPIYEEGQQHYIFRMLNSTKKLRAPWILP